MRIFLLAAGLLAFSAAPASAQSSNDVRCLLVSNFFAKVSKDEKGRRRAENASYFYLGRSAGRFNDAQLKAALDAEQRSLKSSNAGPVMAACAQYMDINVNRLRNWKGQTTPAGKRRQT